MRSALTHAQGNELLDQLAVIVYLDCLTRIERTAGKEAEYPCMRKVGVQTSGRCYGCPIQKADQNEYLFW